MSAVRAAAEERRLVTVLFCDLVGFTARSDRADPEDVGAWLRPYHVRQRAEIDEGIWHEAPAPAPTPPSAVPTG